MISARRGWTYFAPSTRALPGRGDELAELLDGRLAEDRRRVADEVDPELAGDLVDLGLRPEPHQALLEALRLERPGERFLDDEHDPMAARAQDLADPDAVVRRAERALGEEDDRLRVCHATIIADEAPDFSAGLQRGTQALVLGFVDLARGEAGAQRIERRVARGRRHDRRSGGHAARRRRSARSARRRSRRSPG